MLPRTRLLRRMVRRAAPSSSSPIRKLLSTAAGPKPKVLVLGGPSAVGKSTVAYNIAKEHNGVVISADAVKVYKRLQLGTNKQPFEGVPLKMTDIIEPNDLYTVHDYASDAMAEIRQALADGKMPIIVGGTGLYLRWLIYGSLTAPKKNEEVFNKILAALHSENNWDVSIKRLETIDPKYAATIPRNQYNRLARGLEVYKTTGRILSSFEVQDTSVPRSSLEFDFRAFSLHLPTRIELFRKADYRCEKMVSDGLIMETLDLILNGMDPDSTAARAVGYRQAIQFIHQGVYTEREFMIFLRSMMAKTRQLIHRQVKWFGSEPLYQWVLAEPTPLGGTEHIENQLMDLYSMTSDEYDAYISTPEWTERQKAAKVVPKKQLQLLARYQPEDKLYWQIRKTHNPHLAKQLEKLRNEGPRLKRAREIITARMVLARNAPGNSRGGERGEVAGDDDGDD